MKLFKQPMRPVIIDTKSYNDKDERKNSQNSKKIDYYWKQLLSKSLKALALNEND